MPTCIMCEEEVTRCNMCGLTFCAKCGNIDEKLCAYCLDDDISHYDDDDFSTNENWYEKDQLLERFYK